MTRAVLFPATGKAVAQYGDGACAAVLNTVGKGRVLTFGFMPGILYKGDRRGGSTYVDGHRALVVKPALAAAGPGSLLCEAPQLEMARFDHQTGIAVTLNTSRRDASKMATLRVKTPRPVKRVFASLAGDLTWKRNGAYILIDLPVPETVDVVILQ